MIVFKIVVEVGIETNKESLPLTMETIERTKAIPPMVNAEEKTKRKEKTTWQSCICRDKPIHHHYWL
jgi:hypothetical protein